MATSKNYLMLALWVVFPVLGGSTPTMFPTTTPRPTIARRTPGSAASEPNVTAAPTPATSNDMGLEYLWEFQPPMKFDCNNEQLEAILPSLELTDEETASATTFLMTGISSMPFYDFEDNGAFKMEFYKIDAIEFIMDAVLDKGNGQTLPTFKGKLRSKLSDIVGVVTTPIDTTKIFIVVEVNGTVLEYNKDYDTVTKWEASTLMAFEGDASLLGAFCQSSEDTITASRPSPVTLQPTNVGETFTPTTVTPTASPTATPTSSPSSSPTTAFPTSSPTLSPTDLQISSASRSMAAGVLVTLMCVLL